MNQQKHDHPENIHCGFCGNEIRWGYTACSACGATVTYGLEAARGIWLALSKIGVFIVGSFVLIATVVTFFAVWIKIKTGIDMLDILIALGCAGIVCYVPYQTIDKMTDWIVKKTRIAKKWRNKYVFYRAS